MSEETNDSPVAYLGCLMARMEKIEETLKAIQTAQQKIVEKQSKIERRLELIEAMKGIS